MYFIPGPKALAEFGYAHRSRKNAQTTANEIGEPRPQYMRRTKPEPQPAAIDPALVAEFTRRGVTEDKARELLARLKPDQPVLEQLEWGDRQIEHGKIKNPAGFYISLVDGNVIPPPTFETRAKRQAREEEERRQAEERRQQEELETDYHYHCQEKIESFIAGIDASEVASIREIKRQEMRAAHPRLTDGLIESFTNQEVRRELEKRVPLPTIEEFMEKMPEQPQEVAPASPEPAAEFVPAAHPIDRPATASQNSQNTPSETEPAAIQDSATPTQEPAIAPAHEPSDVGEAGPAGTDAGELS
jgi:hypothetical protein